MFFLLFLLVICIKFFHNLLRISYAKFMVNLDQLNSEIYS